MYQVIQLELNCKKTVSNFPPPKKGVLMVEETGGWLSRLFSWPFKESIPDNNNKRVIRPRSQETTHTIDYILTPTASSSVDDLTRFPIAPEEHTVFSHSQSILSVPIPVEEETFPAYLAGLSDPAFPRYRLVLPKRTKMLVLDLDETLVHSTSTSANVCDFLVEVLVEHMSCLYYVNKRPFVEHFLDVVSNWYQLAIYTASLREYADPVVNMLDRGRRIFVKRLFRTACMEKDGMYMKDLTLADPDLSQVFLLDNSAISFILNPGNCHCLILFADHWFKKMGFL